MRNKSTALFCVLLLAAAHGSVAVLAPNPSTINPQAAESGKVQETVDLKISGMT